MALVIACAIAFWRLDGAARWGLVAVGVTVEIAEAALMIRWSRRRGSTVGSNALVGVTGVVIEPCRPSGRVRVGNETWNAHCQSGCDVGTQVRIVAVHGLELDVTAVEPRTWSL